MARFIALGFLLLPLVEIALFIVVGRAIGLFPTLALVIGAALLGSILLRQQGLGVISRMRENIGAGTVPGRAMFDTMIIGLAALLLILPGFLSDGVALLLLIPPVRDWLFAQAARNVTVVETTTSYRYGPNGQPDRSGGQKTIDLDGDRWRDEQ